MRNATSRQSNTEECTYTRKHNPLTHDARTRHTHTRAREKRAHKRTRMHACIHTHRHNKKTQTRKHKHTYAGTHTRINTIRTNCSVHIRLCECVKCIVPAVCFHMAAEKPRLCKACFTHSADVRLLASVSSHVNCHRTGSTTSVRTHFTCEWLLASVSAHVRPTIACLCKC